MNTPTISPPLPPARTELPQGSLDERIALAEQRLVARDQALRHRAQALLQRTQKATEPRRMLRPALYALGALALVWGAARLLRRRPGADRPGSTSAASAVAPAAASASRFGEVPWVRAAALLWPLLPVAWRGRMGPDAASLLVAVGLPLAGLLFRKRPRGPLQPQRSR
ncbi:MAG: hypothetical protein ACRC2B_16555 [Rubrivivax sp.]